MVQERRSSPKHTGVIRADVQSQKLFIRKAHNMFKFLSLETRYHRSILSSRPKCYHRCVSLKETPLKPVLILKRVTRRSTAQTSMRTKWFKHVAMKKLFRIISYFRNQEGLTKPKIARTAPRTFRTIRGSYWSLPSKTKGL